MKKIKIFLFVFLKLFYFLVRKYILVSFRTKRLKIINNITFSTNNRKEGINKLFMILIYF